MKLGMPTKATSLRKQYWKLSFAENPNILARSIDLSGYFVSLSYSYFVREPGYDIINFFASAQSLGNMNKFRVEHSKVSNLAMS